VYEVSQFVSNHPGEGINDIYLRHYNQKNVSQEFEHYHFDNEPIEWLISSKEKGFDPKTGIFYVGPCFFDGTKKLPHYFHHFTEAFATEYLTKSSIDKSFIVIPSKLNPNSGLKLLYRETASLIQATELIKKDQWFCETSFGNTLEELLTSTMLNKGYQGI